MGCTFTYGQPKDVHAMKNRQFGSSLVNWSNMFPSFIRVIRSNSSFYLCGTGENHVLDLLQRNSSARIWADLPIDLLVVRNDSLVIAQVMESSHKIQSGHNLGVFHHMNRKDITGASLYFALQKDIFPRLRAISPPPRIPAAGLHNYNTDFFRR